MLTHLQDSSRGQLLRFQISVGIESPTEIKQTHARLLSLGDKDSNQCCRSFQAPGKFMMTTEGTFWQQRRFHLVVGGVSLFVFTAVLWVLWPRHWTVTIVTTPPGAQVLADSNVIGTTPLTVKLSADCSELTLQLDGYETENLVPDPAHRQFSVKLALVPKPLEYTVNVLPPEAALTVAEPGATVEGRGQRRIVTFAKPNGTQQFTLIASLANFADVVRVVQPVPGRAENLDLTFPVRLVFDFPQLVVPFTVRYDDVEFPPGNTHFIEVSNFNGHHLQITAGGIPFVDLEMAPTLEGETIRIAVPPPAAVYKVGRLPKGIGLTATDTAGVTLDSDGCHWVVVPAGGKGKAAKVSVTAGKTLLSTLELPPLDRVEVPPVEWATYEIEGGSPDTTLSVQGDGHIVHHPDGRGWLLVPRPDGEQWVKLTAIRPGFKETARLLTPVAGEKSVVRLALLPLLLPFEYALPDDVVFFVNVSNYGSFKRRLNELRGVQLCQSPVMKPFVSQFLGKSGQSVNQIREQTGIDVVNLCAAHTGQIVQAWTLGKEARPATLATKATKRKPARAATPGVPAKPSVGFFMSDVPESRDMIQAMLDEMQRIGKVGDGFLSVTKSDVLVGVTDSNGASDSEAAKRVVTRLGTEPEDSFALNPRLKEFRDRVGGTGDFEVFMDYERVHSQLFEEGMQKEFILGDGNLKSAGLSFSIAQGPFDTLCHLLFSTNGQPLLSPFLMMPPQSLKPEAWVPQDVTGYYSFTLDHSQLKLSYGTLLPREYEAVWHLRKRLTIVTDSTESRGFLVPRALLAWECDPAGAKSLRVLQSQLLGPYATKFVTKQGHPIYLFDYGAELEQTISDDTPVPVGKVTMVVTKTHVMLTTHIELLDKVLNHQGPGLAETPDYLRVAAHLPEQCSLVVYQSPDQNRLLFQSLKTGRLPGFLKGGADLIGAFGGLIEALDGRQLPDYDAVKQFMTPSGGYGVMDDTGFHYKHFTLNR